MLAIQLSAIPVLRDAVNVSKKKLYQKQKHIFLMKNQPSQKNNKKQKKIYCPLLAEKQYKTKKINTASNCCISWNERPIDTR